MTFFPAYSRELDPGKTPPVVGGPNLSKANPVGGGGPALFCSESVSIAYFKALDYVARLKGMRVVNAPRSGFFSIDVIENRDGYFLDATVGTAGAWVVFQKSSVAVHYESVMQGEQAGSVIGAWPDTVQWLTYNSLNSDGYQEVARRAPNLNKWFRDFCRRIPGVSDSNPDDHVDSR